MHVEPPSIAAADGRTQLCGKVRRQAMLPSGLRLITTIGDWSPRTRMELPRILRQTIKTQLILFFIERRLSHGVVATKIHS